MIFLEFKDGVFVDQSHDLDQAENDQCITKISNDFNVLDMASQLDSLTGILLNFPAYKDGRAYSQAAILRNQLGFKGDLIASGDILYDQIAMMIRVGINKFMVETNEDKTQHIEKFNMAIAEHQFHYQPSYMHMSHVAHMRHA